MHLHFALTAVPQLPTGIRAASFSIPDTLFLVVIALIVFGPKKLPEISRQLGKLLFEFRRASNDFKLQIEEELRLSEQSERQKQLNTQAVTPEPATPVAISAEEIVAAASGPELMEEHTILPPTMEHAAVEAQAAQPLTIQPPSTGNTVSTLPPNRGFGSTAQRGAPGENGGAPISADEMLAAAREAGDTQSAAAEPHSAAAEAENSTAPVYAQGGEAASVHHG